MKWNTCLMWFDWLCVCKWNANITKQRIDTSSKRLRAILICIGLNVECQQSFRLFIIIILPVPFLSSSICHFSFSIILYSLVFSFFSDSFALSVLFRSFHFTRFDIIRCCVFSPSSSSSSFSCFWCVFFCEMARACEHQHFFYWWPYEQSQIWISFSFILYHMRPAPKIS